LKKRPKEIQRKAGYKLAGQLKRGRDF